MKKITLLASAALITMTAFSQNLTSNAEGSPSFLERDSAAILWEQPNDPDGTGGIISDINNLNQAVYSADDFIFTDTSEIESIFVSGFNNNQNLLLDLEAISIYIYANDDVNNVPDSDPSIPGTGLLEIVELAYPDPSITLTQVDQFFSFNVDIVAATGSSLELSAGTYWLVFATKIDIPDFDGANRWNWSQGIEGAPGTNSAHLIDVDDVFAGGFTTWTPFADLGIAWSQLEFTLEGEPVLSVNDNPLSFVSVYPNPATDIINIKTPSNIQVTGATLYDLLGKNTGVVYANGQVDVSALSRGVYMLTVDTNEGSLTQKIVKR